MNMPQERTLRRAVAERNEAFDGRFVYGVVTTGVYCRPSCPSRRPNPENLRFFASPNAAEAGGFRPCKRCRPKENPERLELESLARHIEGHAEQRLPLAELAARVGWSSSRLQRRFKAAFGVSPKTYQDGIRARNFKAELKAGNTVTGAVYAAGYGSSSRAYGGAARNIGMTPKRYREGAAGETIYHAFRQTALGPLLLAATNEGVCFAQFGENREALVGQLRREFPNATHRTSRAQGSPALTDWIEALGKHLEQRGPAPDLALDLRGTAFQLKVWEFLLGVEPGDVVSYGEVAAGIGKPTAVRAAAAACGANRVAVLVPCHRVLRGDGALGGYRWGAERKRTLLDAERRTR